MITRAGIHKLKISLFYMITRAGIHKLKVGLFYMITHAGIHKLKVGLFYTVCYFRITFVSLDTLYKPVSYTHLTLPTIYSV